MTALTKPGGGLDGQRWRLLPPATPAERATIRDRILAAGGLDRQVPCDDDSGEQLALFDEVDVLRELQEAGQELPDPELARYHFENDAERLGFVLQYLPNREITAGVRRQVAENVLRLVPDLSDRRIADMVGFGIDHKTVSAARDRLEQRGEIPHVDKHIDTLGRYQPGTRATATVSEESFGGAAVPARDPFLSTEQARRRAANRKAYGPDNCEPGDFEDDGPGWRLRCADFRHGDVDEASVDLVVCDVPFDGNPAFFSDLASACQRALKDDRALAWMIGEGNFTAPAMALREAGFEDTLVGHVKFTKPVMRMRKGSQTVDSQPFYIVTKGTVSAAHLRQELSYPDDDEAVTYPGGHPYRKRPETFGEWITALSPKGGLVWDPCCGSGSVGEAALAHGRRFLGTDIKQACVEEAAWRLRRASKRPIVPPSVPDDDEAA